MLCVCVSLQRPGAVLSPGRSKSDFQAPEEERVLLSAGPACSPSRAQFPLNPGGQPRLLRGPQGQAPAGPHHSHLLRVQAHLHEGRGSAPCPPHPCAPALPQHLTLCRGAGPGQGWGWGPRPGISTLRAEHLISPLPGMWALPALPTAHLSHGPAGAAGSWYRSPWQSRICRSGF